MSDEGLLHTPLATYRLQFNRNFRLKDATRLVPYLAQLGISDLYASPLLKARTGSLHGYDVVDPTRLNPELGTEKDLKQLAQALKKRGMGLLLDIVPNHMGIAGGENPWWEDVIKKRRRSRFAEVFDIDWRASKARLVYRRFFDIDELCGVRVEDPVVFNRIHQTVFRWVRQGWIHGLRIDHPDGLLDPKKYLKDLQKYSPKKPLYIVVEKILSPKEDLPSWPVQGTTGYEFLNVLSALFVNPKGVRTIQDFYSEWTGAQGDAQAVVRKGKKDVLSGSLFPDLDRLVTKAMESYGDGVRRQSFKDRKMLREAVKEVLVNFPVYRTYRGQGALSVSAQDRHWIQIAVRKALKNSDPILKPAIRYIKTKLLSKDPGFALRFQQLSGPAMAKGLEDTAFYRHYPLLSLNEVGGEPGFEGYSVQEFHRIIKKRNKLWPHALSTTATHDTKRNEDVRARIHVLSEIPDVWKRAVLRWSRWNAAHKTVLEGYTAPTPNEEYLIYQTLIGAWPLTRLQAKTRTDFVRRIEGCMEKSLREAKVHSSWAGPNHAHEGAVKHFIQAVLRPSSRNLFLTDFLEFHRRIGFCGALNSLSQLFLKMTLPGVPDIYQGSELWQFLLVDPDNRRPVDFSKHEQLFVRIRQDLFHENLSSLGKHYLAHWQDGRIKQLLLFRTLSYRRVNKTLFLEGSYVPLRVSGKLKNHIVAFARRDRNQWVFCVALRLAESLFSKKPYQWTSIDWGMTQVHLPRGARSKWVDLFTNQIIVGTGKSGNSSIRVASILKHLPFALLEGTNP